MCARETMPSSKRPFVSSPKDIAALAASAPALGLCIVAMLLSLAVLAVPSSQAHADPVQAGPFMVDGPTTGYRYDPSAERLNITTSGVTIAGMADGWTGGNNVRLTGQGQNFVVNLGTGVDIGTVTGVGASTFNVTGTGNRIGSLSHPVYFSGSGSVAISGTAGNIDSMGPTVIIEGTVSAEWQHQSGTVVLVPGASLNALVVLGGTLDLSQITLGSPVPVEGLTLGSSGVDASVIVPFGTDSLRQLVTAPSLFVRESPQVPAYSNGEEVGYVQPDGTIYYTATRTVTFLGFDGQPLATEEVRLFQPATAPEVTAPEGYRFVGWDRDFSRVSENMDVQALFERVPGPAPEPDPDPVPPSGGGEGSAGSGTASSDLRPLAATGDGAPALAFALSAVLAGSAAGAAFSRRAR